MEDFFLNAFLFTSRKADLVIQTSWTLYYEVVFYLLFIMLVLSKRIGIVGIFLWSILLLLQIVNKNISYSFLYPLNLLFVFGLVTSTFSLNVEKINVNQKEVLSIISIILGIVLFAITAIYWSKTGIDDWTTDPVIIIGFGSASSFLLMAPISRKIENFVMHHKLFGLLGDASYSIYLVHLQIQKIAINIKAIFEWIWDTPNQFIADFLFIVVALISIVIGIFFYKKIERPLLLFFRAKVARMG